MKIQVLGTGCPKCKKTAEVMKEAAVTLGLIEGADYVIEKVEAICDIMKFGVTLTPGVAIDGNVISTGKVPSVGEATTFITNVLSQGGA
jgi:small redox-active disulfide protein 2